MSLITGSWVEKQGKGTFGNKWQKRWLVQDGPFLKYYLSPQHVNPQGQIDFSQVEEVRLATKGTVGVGNVAMFPFEVAMQAHLKRVYCIRTEKEEDREFLVSALQTLLDQCKTGSAPASLAEEALDPAAKEQATLDELSDKIKELSKEVEGRITLRRFYTLVQEEERHTKDKEGNITSTKTVEVKKRIMDKECLLDLTTADIINLEFNLDVLKEDKAAQQAKNVRILFKVDNSIYKVLAKQWEELGAQNGCQESSHVSKWQHTDVVLPNLLYRPELVKASGLFNKLITDFVKNTFIIPVSVTFNLDALHERAKTADADTPSAMSHPSGTTESKSDNEAIPDDDVIDLQQETPDEIASETQESPAMPDDHSGAAPAYDTATQPSEQSSFDAQCAQNPGEGNELGSQSQGSMEEPNYGAPPLYPQDELPPAYQPADAALYPGAPSDFGLPTAPGFQDTPPLDMDMPPVDTQPLQSGANAQPDQSQAVPVEAGVEVPTLADDQLAPEPQLAEPQLDDMDSPPPATA